MKECGKDENGRTIYELPGAGEEIVSIRASASYSEKNHPVAEGHFYLITIETDKDIYTIRGCSNCEAVKLKAKFSEL